MPLLLTVIMERVYFESKTGNALRAVRIMPETAILVLDESCEPPEVATSHTGRTTNTVSYCEIINISLMCQSIGQINYLSLRIILFSSVPFGNTLVLFWDP